MIPLLSALLSPASAAGLPDCVALAETRAADEDFDAESAVCLQVLTRPMPRLRRAVREGMAADGLDVFTVTVHLDVDERGRVAETTWEDGPSWAEADVRRALARWRFEPVTLDGVATPVELDLTLSLGKRAP